MFASRDAGWPIASFALCFDARGVPGDVLWSFSCDRGGAVDVALLTAEEAVNLRRCLDGTYEVEPARVRSFVLRRPALSEARHTA